MVGGTTKQSLGSLSLRGGTTKQSPMMVPEIASLRSQGQAGRIYVTLNKNHQW